MSAPCTILVAALGGEGGGVLSGWIVSAATAAGYPVQSTSIPGVAQRTGATTYYIEMLPEARAPQAPAPVMALYPSPGHIDVMIASELVEAGRAIESGYVSPERTVLVASTHRVYAIAEKSAAIDGRYDDARILRAARELARHALLANFEALAREAGAAINAVLLGAAAGSGRLPLSVASLEAAVRESGVAVESNLRGLRAGLEFARGARDTPPAAREGTRPCAPEAESEHSIPPALGETLPAEAREIVAEGARRLADYQDEAYAQRYLAQVARIAEVDGAAGGAAHGFVLTRETARHLALRMSFEDVIRVADLKSRTARLERVRGEAGAAPGEPVRITEYMKPGVEELAGLLPPGAGRRLRDWARRRDLTRRLHVGLRLRSDTVIGWLRLRLLARLRGWRRRTLRFAEEQALIARWLDAVAKAAPRDYELALEVVECARLVRGYSDTWMRGRDNFVRIFEEMVEPLLETTQPGGDAAARVRAAREAALADPEGEGLARVLAGESPAPPKRTPEPAVRTVEIPEVSLRGGGGKR